MHLLILTPHSHAYTNPAGLSTPVLGSRGRTREPLFHRTGPGHSVLFQSGETKCVDLADFFSLSASDVDFSSDCERNASQRRLPRQPWKPWQHTDALLLLNLGTICQETTSRQNTTGWLFIVHYWTSLYISPSPFPFCLLLFRYESLLCIPVLTGNNVCSVCRLKTHSFW